MPQPTKEIIAERANFMQSIVDCVHKPSVFSDVFLGHKLFEYNRKRVKENEKSQSSDSAFIAGFEPNEMFYRFSSVS